MTRRATGKLLYLCIFSYQTANKNKISSNNNNHDNMDKYKSNTAEDQKGDHESKTTIVSSSSELQWLPNCVLAIASPTQAQQAQLIDNISYSSYMKDLRIVQTKQAICLCQGTVTGGKVGADFVLVSSLIRKDAKI